MNKELIQNHIKEKNKQGFTNKKYDTFFRAICIITGTVQI